MMQKRFSFGLLLSLGALSLSAAGCEVSTCTGSKCFDDEDAGADGTSDGSADGSGDGASDGSDGSSDQDAGLDAGGDGSADGGIDAGEVTGLSIDEFCAEQASVGLGWATVLDSCCSATPAEQEGFLRDVFGYSDQAVTGCATAFQNRVDGGNVTFHADKARACVDAYVAVLMAPPETCPSAGFDLRALAGSIGHGAPSFKQIPACRAAFAGKLAAGDQCTDHFECSGDLRCLPMAGSGDIKSCKEPVASGSECISFNDCADGLVCLGLTGAGDDGVCRAASALSSFSAPCNRSLQCEAGLVCDANVCANAEGGTPVCAE